MIDWQANHNLILEGGGRAEDKQRDNDSTTELRLHCKSWPKADSGLRSVLTATAVVFCP